MLVSQLYVHPVKSCKAISATSVLVEPQGMAYDRRWMVVRADTGRFITQRQVARLCQVGTALPPEALRGEPLPADAALELSAPGAAAPVRVPLAPRGAQPLRTVTVWEWTGVAADEGDAAAEWLSAYLGTPARLVRYLGRSSAGGGNGSAQAGGEGAATDPPSVRGTDPEFTPRELAQPEVAFADGFPLLVATEEALGDLNARIITNSDDDGNAAVPMNRFRANVVLAGTGAPWADDAWAGVVIGGGGGDDDGGDSSSSSNGAELAFVKPCSRCSVPTINQATAEKGDEPTRALSAFRSGKALGWANADAGRKSWTHAVHFGWNAAPLRCGLISVGDTVAVTGAREWA